MTEPSSDFAVKQIDFQATIIEARMTDVLGEINSAALANNMAMGGSQFTQADAALALDVMERMVDVHIIKIKSAIAGYRRDSV